MARYTVVKKERCTNACHCTKQTIHEPKKCRMRPKAPKSFCTIAVLKLYFGGLKGMLVA
jgi:hypothetical protein